MLSAAEKIAKRFHEVYEEIAPTMGWDTQERSKKSWEELPIENKWLMVKVVEQLLEEKVIYKGRGVNAQSEVSQT
jgi:hypothetical protein